MNIRRGHVFEDSFNSLNRLSGAPSLQALTLMWISGKELRHRIKVFFVSEFEMVEAGIDGGGVFKEFMTQYVPHGLYQPPLILQD